MQDQEQIAAMMELLGDKQKKPAPFVMSPELVDLLHQETFAPQQGTQFADAAYPNGFRTMQVGDYMMPQFGKPVEYQKPLEQKAKAVAKDK